MPSRPVLIGRGLVPTPYTTTQHTCARVHYPTITHPPPHPPCKGRERVGVNVNTRGHTTHNTTTRTNPDTQGLLELRRP